MKSIYLVARFIAAVACLSSSVVLAQGIGGRWYHDGKPTSINVSGMSVTITNENGQSSSGHIVGNELTLPFLGVTGVVGSAGRVISWSNGTTWTRERDGQGSKPEGASRLEGRWFHDGKPTFISVSGRDITITNEVGQSSRGSVSGNDIVIGSLRGQVSHHGKRISWSNGTEWRR